METKNSVFIEWLSTQYNKKEQDLNEPEMLGYMIKFLYDTGRNLKISEHHSYRMLINKLSSEIEIFRK